MPTKKTVKAYDNKGFLHSHGARSLRILSEYVEPDQRLRQLDVGRAVIFFGSARTPRKDAHGYYAAAADLAEKMARWTLATHPAPERCYICTGGGPGIMQAAHEGGARVDAHINIGFNISLPFEQHINPCVQADRAFEFHYFFMRKFWFINVAAAAVIFPGGFGTLDEIFELLTLTQTGKSARMPIVLYGKRFWSKVVDFKMLAAEGVISPEDLQLFHIVDSVDAAFKILSGGVIESSAIKDRRAAERPVKQPKETAKRRSA